MSTDDEKFLVYRIKFLLLLILQIASIIVSLGIFAFFLTHQTLLHTSQNRTLLLLLAINFLEALCVLPMPIHFYRLGYISPATAAYCVWWTYMEYTFNAISVFFMATLSVQRHMLIFHSHVLRIRWKRYLCHHLPLLFSLVYPTVLYLALVVFYPCDHTQWDFTAHLCGGVSCYLLNDKVLATADWIIDSGLPPLIIFTANILLIGRVVKQQRRLRREASWRKHRRMTVQLVAISALYMVAWLPSVIIAVVQLLFSPTFLLDFQTNHALNLIYLVCLFLPWVYLGQIRELTKWIRKHLPWRRIRRNIIAPTQTRHIRTRY